MSVSSNILNSVKILYDQYSSELQFDKTVTAEIYSIVNIDTGEYKVKYQSNIFSVFSENLDTTYEVGDSVYVKIPQNDMSKRKIIIGEAETSATTTTNMAISQQITPVSGNLIDYYHNISSLNNKKYEQFSVTKNSDNTNNYSTILNNIDTQQYAALYLNKGSALSDAAPADANFMVYSSQCDIICISADFTTTFKNTKTTGNYGLKVGFFLADSSQGIVEYQLDTQSFNGQIYNFVNAANQQIVLTVGQGYLGGLAYIKAFAENFENIKSDEKIYIDNISIKYVTVEDFSEGYHIVLSAPQGDHFESGTSSLTIVPTVYYNGTVVTTSSAADLTWYVRDVSVDKTSDYYNADAGCGWKDLSKVTSEDKSAAGVSINSKTHVITLTNLSNDKDYVHFSVDFKLVVNYNEKYVGEKSICITDQTSGYAPTLTQEQGAGENKTTTYLKIDNSDNSAYQYLGIWYYELPDGTYNRVDWDYLAGLGKSDTTNSSYTVAKQYAAIAAINNVITTTDAEKDKLLENYYSNVKKAITTNSDYKMSRIKIDPSLLEYDYVTFTCEVWRSDTNISETDWTKIGTLSKKIKNTKNIADVSIKFLGTTNYNYDESGDIDETEVSLDRTLKPTIIWEDGVSALYTLEWYIDGREEKIPEYDNATAAIGQAKASPQFSMLENLFVDKQFNLHYNIRQKYNSTYQNNNVTVKLVLLNGETYSTTQQINFTKDGDQETNGSTFTLVVRPVDASGNRVSGFCGISTVYGNQTTARNNFNTYTGVTTQNGQYWYLKAFLYKDGVQLSANDLAGYTITATWNNDCANTSLLIKSVAAANNEYLVSEDGSVTTDWSKATGQKFVFTSTNLSSLFKVFAFGNKNQARYVRVYLEITKDGETKNVSYIYPIDVLETKSGYKNITTNGKTYPAVDITGIPAFADYTSQGIAPTISSDPLVFYCGIDTNSDNGLARTTSYVSSKVTNYSTFVSNNTSLLELKYHAGSSSTDTDSAETTETDADSNNYYYLNVPEKHQDCSKMVCLTCNGTYGTIYHTIILALEPKTNEAIFGWDGTSIKIVEGSSGNSSYIMAPQVGAGKIDADTNLFSGVLMGATSENKKTGVFGYQEGVNTYGLLEDGTAYFGAAKGGGRITIDGTTALIYGGGAPTFELTNGVKTGKVESQSKGMVIVLADLFSDTNKSSISTIDYTTGKDVTAIDIGAGNFFVNYDGELHAQYGNIGGWYMNDTTLSNLKIYSDTSNSPSYWKLYTRDLALNSSNEWTFVERLYSNTLSSVPYGFNSDNQLLLPKYGDSIYNNSNSISATKVPDSIVVLDTNNNGLIICDQLYATNKGSIAGWDFSYANGQFSNSNWGSFGWMNGTDSSGNTTHNIGIRSGDDSVKYYNKSGTTLQTGNVPGIILESYNDIRLSMLRSKNKETAGQHHFIIEGQTQNYNSTAAANNENSSWLEVKYISPEHQVGIYARFA